MLAAVPILDDLRQLVRDDPRPHVRIATAAKIHPTTFSAFMAGRRGLSIESAEVLAEVLGHPIKTTPPKKK